MNKKKFKLVSKYSPAGDQPKAIDKLIDGLESGLSSKFYWVLLDLEKLLQ